MTDSPAFLEVPEDMLQDLIGRLRRTRWPEPWPRIRGWEAGVPQDELRRLVHSWSTNYDWRRSEGLINGLPWHSAEIGGSTLRYLLFEGGSDSPAPIVMTNGWPSSFLEFVPLARLLATQVDGSSFTVVVPVLPGFPGGVQPSASRSDIPVHELWHRLMSEVLGYRSYYAHGGDLGAGTASLLAQAHPEAVAGLHLLAVADPPSVDPASISQEEQSYLDEVGSWYARDGAYEHQQMTRPATLSYALTDSPAGLLAWMLEKYHDWTDRRLDEISRMSTGFILDQASLYWFTNAIGTSFRPYFDYARGGGERVERVAVPTAFASFPKDLSHPPRSWIERTYELVRYERMPRGGHFAAVEEPDLLASDLRSFVSEVVASLPRRAGPA